MNGLDDPHSAMAVKPGCGYVCSPNHYYEYTFDSIWGSGHGGGCETAAAAMTPASGWEKDKSRVN